MHHTLLAALLAAPLGAAPAHVPGRVLVKLRSLPGLLPAAVPASGFAALPAGHQDLLRRHGAWGLRRVFAGVTGPRARAFSPQSGARVAVPDLYGWHILDVSSGTDAPALARALAAEPLVEKAEPDGFYTVEAVPNDPQLSAQWFHNNTGQTGGDAGDDIRSLQGWDIGKGSTQTVIAVLDTGVDLTHPDLTANLGPGYDFIENDSVPQDTDGHGTHVSGIIAAAADNGAGVAGVMWRARLMPVRVCQVTCPWSAIASGLHYAADNGARVANMSIGGYDDSALISDAVDYASSMGVLLVAAACNDDTTSPCYPAAYASVIAVAATDHRDVRATFSNYGGWVDIAAPGVDILSTYPSSTYSSLQGTSMASPVVAGAAGLILANRPDWTAAEVRSRLLSTAEPIDAENPSYAGQLGAGRVNLRDAVPPRWEVTALSLTPDGPSLGNGAGVSFTADISTTITLADVRAALVDQRGVELARGAGVQYSLASATRVSGSLQLGALSLDSPLTSLLTLRFIFGAAPYAFHQDVKTWRLAETAAVPPGGNAAVWNAVMDPDSGRGATVRVTLRAAGRVKVTVHGGDGRLVRRLADEDAPAGVSSWDWNGKSDQGRDAASGVYLVRIEGPGLSRLAKIVLVR